MTNFILRDEFAWGEEAGVGAFAEGDAGVVAQLLGDLTVAGVYGEDRCGTALEHTVGEAAGRGSDVETGEAGEDDGPVGEGVFEFETAAADELEVGAEETDDGVSSYRSAGFVDALLIDEDASGENEGLGAFTRGGVALIDEEFVETEFFGTEFLGVPFCGNHGDLSEHLLNNDEAVSIFSWLRTGTLPQAKD